MILCIYFGACSMLLTTHLCWYSIQIAFSNMTFWKCFSPFSHWIFYHLFSSHFHFSLSIDEWVIWNGWDIKLLIIEDLHLSFLLVEIYLINNPSMSSHEIYFIYLWNISRMWCYWIFPSYENLILTRNWLNSKWMKFKNQSVKIFSKNHSNQPTLFQFTVSWIQSIHGVGWILHLKIRWIFNNSHVYKIQLFTILNWWIE